MHRFFSGAFAAKVSADNPKLGVQTKFIIKVSPAFIGVKAGESNLLQSVNVFVLPAF